MVETFSPPAPTPSENPEEHRSGGTPVRAREQLPEEQLQAGVAVAFLYLRATGRQHPRAKAPAGHPAKRLGEEQSDPQELHTALLPKVPAFVPHLPGGVALPLGSQSPVPTRTLPFDDRERFRGISFPQRNPWEESDTKAGEGADK